jgi:copper chaperone NosL
MTRPTLRAVALAALLVAPSCGRDEVSGPPELRVGRDECVWCGMLIAEDRCATGALVERRGRREHVLFDDLGCLLDLEAEPPEDLAVVERWVRDYGRRTWVAAADAQYLLADHERLRTPMASGMVAFATRAEAERAQAEHGGRIVGAEALAAYRKAWLEARWKPRDGESE